MLTTLCLAIAIGTADPLPAREIEFSFQRKAFRVELLDGERRWVYMGADDATFDGCTVRVEPGEIIHRDRFESHGNKHPGFSQFRRSGGDIAVRGVRGGIHSPVLPPGQAGR